MNEFSSTSVAELRKMLIDSGKYSQEDVEKIKGKSNLVQAILELQGNDEPNFKNFINEISPPTTPYDLTESLAQNLPQDSIIPCSTDPDWHDYVMSQFVADELEDGTYPKIFGLRRVAEVILGPIVQSGPTQLDGPSSEDKNTGRASCVYTVVFRTKDGEIEFRAAAGASPHNIDENYNIYPEAIAEVRAEARAIRKALRLRCVSAEEVFRGNKQQPIVSEPASSGEWSETDKISAAQEMFIKTKLKENNIDLEQFLKHAGYNYDNLRDVNKKVAMEMMQLIHDYGTSSKTSKPIPEEILIKKG